MRSSVPDADISLAVGIILCRAAELRQARRICTTPTGLGAGPVRCTGRSLRLRCRRYVTNMTFSGSMAKRTPTPTACPMHGNGLVQHADQHGHRDYNQDGHNNLWNTAWHCSDRSGHDHDGMPNWRKISPAPTRSIPTPSRHQAFLISATGSNGLRGQMVQRDEQMVSPRQEHELTGSPTIRFQRELKYPGHAPAQHRDRHDGDGQVRTSTASACSDGLPTPQEAIPEVVKASFTRR